MERHPNYVLSSGPARRTTKWGAGWALRQSLVDLASVCELLAGELRGTGDPVASQRAGYSVGPVAVSARVLVPPPQRTMPRGLLFGETKVLGAASLTATIAPVAKRSARTRFPAHAAPFGRRPTLTDADAARQEISSDGPLAVREKAGRDRERGTEHGPPHRAATLSTGWPTRAGRNQRDDPTG